MNDSKSKGTKVFKIWLILMIVLIITISLSLRYSVKNIVHSNNIEITYKETNLGNNYWSFNDGYEEALDFIVVKWKGNEKGGKSQ